MEKSSMKEFGSKERKKSHEKDSARNAYYKEESMARHDKAKAEMKEHEQSHWGKGK